MGEGGKRASRLILIFFLLFSQSSVFANFHSCFNQVKQRYAQWKRGLILLYSRYIVSNTMSMLGEAKETDLAEGKIFLKPPCYIRIEQQKPEHEFVLCDGKQAWWYLPYKKVVYKYGSESFAKEMSVLSDIFNGMRDLKEDFDISFKNSRVFVLKPKGWQDIDRIEVCVDKKCHRIVEIKIFNLLGSITCFEIKKEIHQDLDNRLFTFVPPPDVKVIQK
jgi:outer membrane lipoprotein-sorting protein